MEIDINDIISKYLTGNASMSEKKQLISWLKEDEGNKTLFNEIKDIYIASGTIKLIDQNHDQSWNEFHKNVSAPKTIKFTGILKYAAITILAMVVGSAITQYSKKIGSDDVSMSRVEVPVGQMSKLVLFDGTEVWLNSGSVFEYPSRFNKKNRTVYLNGEAYFDVAKNEELPFIIESNRIHVKVLGTSFNFSAYDTDNYTNLTLVEGEVDLLAPTGRLLTKMMPGEMADLSEGKLSIKEVDTSFYDSWKDGKLKYSGAPLGEIAQKLERWYHVSIQFQDEKSKQLKFTGTILKYKPIEQIVKAISIIAPIDYSVDLKPDGKDVILIYSKH